MPVNNNLEKVKLPMQLRFDEVPTTTFKNNLHSIEVKAIDAPSLGDLRKFVIPFMLATWADKPMEDYNLSTAKKNQELLKLFEGKALPTALETVGVTFYISGISLQEVTHILRHRMASFSAECSGDKWWTDKAGLVPNSVQQSTELYKRYRDLVKASKELYCNMIDTKQISIMDARYILPRCLETFYYMRMNLGDCLRFIKQRIDKQIQPETDNIIAYQMLDELCKLYPMLALAIDIHAPSRFYVNTARTGKATNLYFPDEDSDLFEYNEQDFIYQCKRNEMNGTNEDAKNLFGRFLKEYESRMNAHAIKGLACLESHEVKTGFKRLEDDE